MKNYATSWSKPGLIEAMRAEGFPIPEECGDVLLTIPVDGALQIHWVQFLTEERLAQFGRALARMGTPPPITQDAALPEVPHEA